MLKLFVCFALAAVGSVAMAFTGKTPEKAALVVEYRFIGTQLAQATNPEFWQEAGSQTPGCPSGSSLPCAVLTDMPIEDWLDGKADAAQVREDANTRRN
ncbi:hypothetical protein FVR03_17730 [Pontibacter qinzhouensis]|uniref:Uncharacterized protein n=1 Tax=Pontibacter qinzhouensis TaxID=2603253 RepID=A0A5C8JGC5_9BACT|nr:hypothetical protein [Pontibacter qinzhouensis]TXK36452.1 hypothetical protein FVR03_17730 [Pontibacter qinzhouensis]